MASSYYSAIDIGSNSFHMIITEVKVNGSFKIVDREREIIRVGSVKEGLITKEETESAIKILENFKGLCDFYGAKVKAVATSAVREAQNNHEFVKDVFEQTGIQIEIADGKREAELIYKGVKKALNLNNKKVLCLDIGGGSTELVYDNSNCIEVAESFPLGAVRLSKLFFPGFKLTEEGIKACLQHIEQTFLANPNFRAISDFDAAVGSSGTTQAAASLINYVRHGYGLKQYNGYTFTYDELKEVSNLLLSFSSKEERTQIGGIEEKRADILPAGILILIKSFELLKIEKMTISSYALREGIIAEQLSHS